ncbi:MAG: arginine--tRNA ligase, partial [Rubrobacter sp.]
MSFEKRLADAVREAAREAYGIELDGVHVERPNDPGHGDFATNVALANARVFRRNPREVAAKLVEALDAPFVREAEVAGPGFVNLWLSAEALWGEVGSLLDEGDGYGRRRAYGKPIMLEYVSANPTGPMHVGHGRQAAYGDSLARVLEAAGRPVYREYYFNDGGNQIRILGESVAVQYAGIYGREWPVSDPNVLYPGEYVSEIARSLADDRGEEYLEMPAHKALPEIETFATRWCMDDIGRTLGRARVRFDNFFNEKD